MEEVGRQENILLSIGKFGGYKTEEKERIEERERLALRNKVKQEKQQDKKARKEEEEKKKKKKKKRKKNIILADPRNWLRMALG